MECKNLEEGVVHVQMELPQGVEINSGSATNAKSLRRAMLSENSEVSKNEQKRR